MISASIRRAATGLASALFLTMAPAAYGQLLQPTTVTPGEPVIVSPWDPDIGAVHDNVLEYASDGEATAVAFAARIIGNDGLPDTTPVYVTHDRGLTWTMTDVLPVEPIRFNKPNFLKADGFVQNGAGTWMFWGQRGSDVSLRRLFFRSTDNGETWTELEDPFAGDPAPPAFGELALGGGTALLASTREIDIHDDIYAYTIRRSTDFGAAWSAQSLGNRAQRGGGANQPLRAEDFHFATDGAGNWLFLDSDYISRSSDDGQTWETIRIPATRIRSSRAAPSISPGANGSPFSTMTTPSNSC